MKRASIVLSLLVAAGCSRGKTGSTGAAGVAGPVGPITVPPRIESVFPPIASSASIVEVRGSGFSALPAQDRVLVDGVPVTVLTASSGSVVTISGIPPVLDGQTEATLTVEVQGRVSNTFALPLAQPGAERAAIGGGLLAPQALAFDASGNLWVFDASTGVLELDAATKKLSTVIPAGGLAGSPSAGAIAPDGTLAWADGTRVLKVASDGSVQAIAVGLAAPPLAMTFDAAGDLFVLDGTNVDEIAVDGTLVQPFATVTEGDGIALLGGNLYVTDGGASAIDEIALPGGAVTTLVSDSKLSDAAGLTTSGADLVACVSDFNGVGAVRINVGTKAVTSFAPPRPLPGAASNACAASGSTVWESSFFDGGLDFSSGTTWTQGAVSLFDDGSSAATFDGDRMFLAATNRCILGTGTGSVVEATPDGASDIALAGVCAAGIAWDGSRLLVVDSSGGAVKAVDPDLPGTATTLVPAGGQTGYGIAASASGATQGFYLALSGAPPRVAHVGPTGTTLQPDVFGSQLDGRVVGLAVADASARVFVATTDGVWAVGVDGAGAPVGSPARLVGAQQDFSAISSLGPDGGGGVWFLDSGEVYDVDANGVIRWIADVPNAREVTATPWGELLYTIQGSYPIARLL